MLSCKESSQLSSQSLDRALSIRERLSLRLHLLICDVCSRFVKQMNLLRLAIRRMTQQTEQDENLVLPPEAKKRIADKIDSQHDQSH